MEKSERIRHIALQRTRMTCGIYLRGEQDSYKECSKGCFSCPKLAGELYALKKELIEDQIDALRQELHRLDVLQKPSKQDVH